MKRVIVLLMIGLQLVIASVAQAEEKPKVIRILFASTQFATQHAYNATQNYIVNNSLLQKEFEKDGIKVDISYIKAAGPGINEALAAGLGDFAPYGDFPRIVSKAAGLKTLHILGNEKGTNIYILALPKLHLKSFKELKGKKIALWRGTANETAFLKMLQTNGLTEKDVIIRNMGGNDGLAALSAGFIDALVSSADRPLVDQGLAVLLADNRDLRTYPLDDHFTSDLSVMEDFARKYPDITKRVVKVFIKADYWASQEKNREEVLQTLVQAGYKYKYQKEDYQNANLKQIFNPLLDQASYKHFQGLIDYCYNRKLIRNKFDVNKWFDKSFSEAALKELGLENYWTQK